MGEYFLTILRELLPGLEWSTGVSYIHSFVLVGRRGYGERNFSVNIRGDKVIVRELLIGAGSVQSYSADLGDHASVRSAFYRAAHHG